MKLPHSLNKLIESLRKLPGVGEKTALRLALFIIDNMDSDDASLLSQSIIDAKTNLSFCSICGAMMEDVCSICEDENRDQETILVIESIKDLIVLEQTNSYFGKYHILGGTIDFSRGVEPEDLNIDPLLKRATDDKEIILALNGTVTGQLTSNYLKELLKDKDVRVSQIAHGLPIGVDLSYADTNTLTIALKNRIKLKQGEK